MSKESSTKLTPEFIRKLAELYVLDKSGNNISSLAKKYGIPYSVLRRKIKQVLKKEGWEDYIQEEYLPVSGFEFLSIGDTFQHDEHLSIWLVVGKKVIDGDEVFILKLANEKSKRHWIRTTLVVEEDDGD